MRLTRMQVEAFRGISSLDLSLDAVTVLIGENNYGKTSLFDVLGLCLARRTLSPSSRFRDDDFHRGPDGGVGPIRIVLTFARLASSEPSEAHEGFAPALRRDRDGGERLRVEFSGSPQDLFIRRRFVDEEGSPLEPQPDASLLDRVQSLHPVLLLRFAHPSQTAGPLPQAAAAAPEKPHERRGRQGLEALISRVYHDLTHTRSPLPAEDITRGLRAARALFGGTGTHGDQPIQRMMREVLSDAERWGGSRDSEVHHVSLGSGTHTVGLLLVLGAMLDVRGRDALPENARPIIAIEEPAAHLHPILLASTWDVIESLHAQTVVTTNSGELLSSVPIKSLRRLARGDRRIEVHALAERTLGAADLRRLSYHIRAKRGGVLFARCWLLVEGESEFWLMTHLAHVLGYDLEAEGVRCVEFAQCGVAPLVKLANDLGIAWHLLADGDDSGKAYVRDAARHLGTESRSDRISQLAHPDVERCLWHHGFDDIYRDAAHLAPTDDGSALAPGRVIAKAVRKKSKPYLALIVAEASAARGPDSVPPVLRHVIESSVAQARASVDEEGRPRRG